MITIHYEDFSNYFDPENGRGCEAGYGNQETMEIFIDERLAPEAKLEAIIHESIELYCKGRLRHVKICDLTRDIVHLLSDTGYITLRSQEDYCIT